MTYYSNVYNVSNDELISGYFRPVTSFLEVPDDELPERSFAVFVDRPVAGTSRLPGQAEFIIERKSAASDFKGVAEPTNDDYEGLYRHRLVFVEGSVQQTLRKLQLLEETEVIKIATAVSQESVFPDQRVLGPTPMLFNHKCLRPDMMPELSDDTQSLLLRVTSLCDSPLDISLAKLFEELGIEINKVQTIVETTADGVIEGVSRESEVSGLKSKASSGSKSAAKANLTKDLGDMEAEDKLAAHLQEESDTQKAVTENSEPIGLIADAPDAADELSDSVPEDELKKANENPAASTVSETQTELNTTESDLRRRRMRRALHTPASSLDSQNPPPRAANYPWPGKQSQTWERATMKPFEVRAYRLYFEGHSQIRKFGETRDVRRKNIRRLQTAPGFDEVSAQIEDDSVRAESIVAL